MKYFIKSTYSLIYYLETWLISRIFWQNNSKFPHCASITASSEVSHLDIGQGSLGSISIWTGRRHTLVESWEQSRKISSNRQKKEYDSENLVNFFCQFHEIFWKVVNSEICVGRLQTQTHTNTQNRVNPISESYKVESLNWPFYESFSFELSYMTVVWAFFGTETKFTFVFFERKTKTFPMCKISFCKEWLTMATVLSTSTEIFCNVMENENSNIGIPVDTWNFVVLNFQLLILLDFITPSGKNTEIEFFMLSNISILFLHFKERV